MAEWPEATAVRTALWRALHLEVDPPPHVIVDDVGLKLLAPGDSWRERGDMDPEFCRAFRASIVARARFVEDLVQDAVSAGVSQYVILGAGLDSFGQRRTDLLPNLHVYEVDQPGQQAWKQTRLAEQGCNRHNVHFVPVDLEAGDNWWIQLQRAGYHPERPAVIASTGVSMYLTKEATAATMRTVAQAAAGSVFAMTYLLPPHLVDTRVQPGLKQSEEGAKAAGTPFVSFYTPDEVASLARQAGFKHVENVSGQQLAERYFSGRHDDLRPPDNAENFLVAVV